MARLAQTALKSCRRHATYSRFDLTATQKEKNHNHLRITRILRCLSLLGLEREATAFFNCLSEIYEDEQDKPMPAISDEAMQYWREAVGDVGRSEQTR